MKKKRARLLCGLALLCVFGLCGAVYGMLYAYVNRFPEDQILRNVYIGPVDASGMTAREAAQAMEDYRQEHLADTCPICGKPAKKMIYWGVAY